MSIKPSVGVLSALDWVKSSHGTVLVRDSKVADGDRLTLTPAAWTGFVTHATA
ncbi:DUF397 domain-containing protein [Streptomyces sp. NPDC006326]|uniref:DUF397 domain-containing protein n=1 Tax=Streptomyces sp. NPDC006326 TaxID=3156752 RepID=UPI0033B77E83